jgi:peptidyl-prolyl cis-trans isomerase SurA
MQSWGVVLAMLATAEIATADAPNKIVVDRVVAAVNDVALLDSELRVRMMPWAAEATQIGDANERKRRLDRLTSQMLDDMVTEELIVQAAHTAKLDVDSSEIQAAVDEVQSSMDLSDADLRAALDQQGYTLEDYRLEIGRQILRLRAVNQLIAPKVHVTDADVRARYEQLQRRVGPGLPPFTQIEDRLRHELRQRELDKLTETWRDELRKQASIEIKI